MLSVEVGSDNVLRLGAFFTVTVLMIVWEVLLPRRRHQMQRGRRWSTNFGFGVLNSLLVPVLMPLAAIEMALVSEERGWGLLNHSGLPVWAAAAIFVLAFDCTIYWQHRLFHLIPVLWRLHRIHHLDREVDVSTAVRFHPVSIILSFGIKLALIVAMGPPAVAVLVAEVLLNVTSMFNHANIYLPEKWDRRLRWWIVTPDMHRIHHSIAHETRDHNYGFNFTFWDRLFGSYLADGDLPQEQIQTGVTGFDARQSSQPLALLLNPFASEKGISSAD